MKSGYDILWSEEAFKSLNQIIKYSIKKLDKRLNSISEYPLIFPLFDSRQDPDKLKI